MSADPPSRRRTSNPPARSPASAPELPAAIAAGLRALADLNRPHPDVLSGVLEQTLRVAAARHQEVAATAAAAVAVRAACAHLHAGGLVDAYFALRTAYDALPRDHRDDGAGPDRQATHRGRDVANAPGRELDAHAMLAQASGVLAQRTGVTAEQASAILRGYAERHGFVLAELASDVVAGRVPLGLNTEPVDLLEFTGQPANDDDTPGARAP